MCLSLKEARGEIAIGLDLVMLEEDVLEKGQAYGVNAGLVAVLVDEEEF